MKKGSEILVKIEKTEFPSTGIGRVDDKLVYAKNCFPGQVVKGRVKRKKADFAEIKPIEVVERAEYEVIAKCPVFGICGGCSSQTLVYEKQLELLSNEVKELFEKAEVNMGEYEGIVGSMLQFEYRNKMEFTFGDMEKGGKLTLGMHMKNKSFGIINVDECKIVDEPSRLKYVEDTHMFETFKNLLVEELQLDESAITMEAELKGDLNINSIELYDLAMMCEDKFGVEIEDDEFHKFVTIGDVVNYLEAHQ